MVDKSPQPEFESFEELPVPDPKPEQPSNEAIVAPRLLQPNRHQVEIRPCDLDALLPADHLARTVWQFSCGVDLSAQYQAIKARVGHSGRPAIDPRLLFALWLYATCEGVGSARKLHRLCQSDIAYQWLCGSVHINAHTLSDFRGGNVELLDRTLSNSVACLLERQLITLDRIAHDGMRVRASAGAASFKRRKTLNSNLEQARALVASLKAQLDSGDAGKPSKGEAARLRAAQDNERRIEEALALMPEAEKRKAKNAKKAPPDESEEDREKREKKHNARVSATDPEAQVMKMANGGFNPAYNCQIACETSTRIITGVDLIASGNDFDQMEPMLEQHQARYQRRPKEALVDGGFAKREQIEKAAQKNVTVYAPVKKGKGVEAERYTRKATDTAGVGDWRERMGKEEAKEIYKERAATIELVNAHIRGQGLQQFNVRGLKKARAVLLWHVLAYNLRCGMKMAGFDELLETLVRRSYAGKGATQLRMRGVARLLKPFSIVSRENPWFKRFSWAIAPRYWTGCN